MSLKLPQGTVAGDSVTIPSPFRRGPVRCSVRHHDGDPEEISVHSTGATFTPSHGGRWWVAFTAQDRTVEGCFWVAPRHV